MGWFSLYIILSMCVLCCAVRRGGARKRTHNQTEASGSSSVANISPELRSLADWNECTVEVLRLACHYIHIVDTGTHEELVNRLFRFYHPNSVDNSTSSVTSNTVTFSAAPTVNHSDLSAIIAAEVRRYLSGNNVQPVSNVPPSLNDINLQRNQQGMNSGPSGNAGLALSSQPGPSSASLSDSGRLSGIDTGGLLQSGFLNSQPGPSNPSSVGGQFSLPFNSGVSGASLLPSGTSDTTASLPAIPKSALDKIKNNEYVSFDTLLPNYTPIAHDEYGLQFEGGSDLSVKVVPKSQTRPKISDFNSWMVAWSNFMRVYTHFHPLRIHELIQYQSFICDFASQFTFSAWIGYEQMFRYRMALNPGLSWARVDEDLYNRYLRHWPLQTMCYVCRNFGHFANACPLRSGRNPGVLPFPAPQRSGASNSVNNSPSVPRASSSSVSRPDAGRGPRAAGTRHTCFYFNSNGCNSERCNFEHVCNVCFGGHPASRCPQQRNSGRGPR